MIIIQAISLKNLLSLFVISLAMKIGRIQEESNQQMNKGCPTPPHTDKRNHLIKAGRSNQKLKTLGIIAFVRTQLGGSAFWCMLGAFLGVVSNQDFQRSIVGIRPANYSTIVSGDLFIVISCPRLNDQPIEVWICLYRDQTANNANSGRDQAKNIVTPRRTPMSKITWQIWTLKPKVLNSSSELCFRANIVGWLSFLVYVRGLLGKTRIRN